LKKSWFKRFSDTKKFDENDSALCIFAAFKNAFSFGQVCFRSSPQQPDAGEHLPGVSVIKTLFVHH